MGFFNSILGGTASYDPTIDWPFASDLPTPDVRLASRQIGPVAFGGLLAEAHCFGRPDSFRRVHHDYFELIYARAGFQLDFEAQCLVYAAFFVGPDKFEPRRGLRYCRPTEADLGQMSDQTAQEALEKLFGQPESIDRDDTETVVNFSNNGLVLEFELNKDRKLKRWNLYPAEKNP